MYTGSKWVYMTSLIGRIVSSIGVPLFWMISGALLLPKKESWKKVYTKRVPRIACCLILFSVVRYFYSCVAEGRSGSVGDFLRSFYKQEIFLPYWFLYVYLGILLVLPFLRKMMQNLTEQEARALFFLLLGWNVLNDISGLCMGTGFVVDLFFHRSVTYFILGCLMENCQMLRQNERKMLVAAIGQAALVMAVAVSLWTRQGGSETWESPTMLLAVSVYYIVRYISEKSAWHSETLRRVTLWCGRNVFGLYLVEDYLRNASALIWEWSAPYISAVPACCVWLLAVFLAGNVLVSILRMVPGLRKLL